MNELYTIFRFSNETKKWSYVFEHNNIDRVWMELSVLSSVEKKSKLNCFIVLKEEDGHIDFICYSEKYLKFADKERLVFKSGLAIVYHFKNKKIPIFSDKEEALVKQIKNEINLWLVNESIKINDIYNKNLKKMEESGIKRGYIKLFRYALFKSNYYYLIRDIVQSEIKKIPENRAALERMWKKINADTFFGEDEFKKIFS